jgi:cystathionine gamma-synthase
VKPRTIAARAGLHATLGLGRPITPAIHQATVYAFSSLEELERVYQDEPGFFYYRNGHPNAAILEETLAALEGGERCAVMSSGMAAISSALLALLRSGDHVVADRNVYGGTFALLTDDLPKLGIETTFVDAQHPDALEAAIRPNTRLLHLESLSNPTLRVADLPRLVTHGKSRGLTVSVDNTFASPALLRPLTMGADLVFHSLAKYIGGHGAVMGGAVIGNAALVTAARGKAVHLGGTMSAFDAWLGLLGVKTLALRMQAHSHNALEVARFLEAQEGVSRVDYPGLPAHPQHALAANLLPHGHSGMLSFELRGGLTAAQAFVRHIAPRIPLAPSLADVSSTLSHPASTSHRALTPEARDTIGVTDGLLRLSVGIEDPQDIIADLEWGLGSMESGFETRDSS